MTGNGGTDRKAAGRSQCRLQRSGSSDVRNAKLIARVSTQRVVRHQLFGNLPGEQQIQAPPDIDCC